MLLKTFPFTRQSSRKSEDKTNGTIQRSYLKFVHVAGCEPVPKRRSSDFVLMLKKADDSNKSLLWLNFVVKELSEGKEDIDFCNSTLTHYLRSHCQVTLIQQ